MFWAISNELLSFWNLKIALVDLEILEKRYITLSWWTHVPYYALQTVKAGFSNEQLTSTQTQVYEDNTGQSVVIVKLPDLSGDKQF